MENQRIRLSKKLLKNALLELLREKRIDKISISELCSAAQINRTTFYKYYGNQYDLLAEMEQDFFRQLQGGEDARRACADDDDIGIHVVSSCSLNRDF